MPSARLRFITGKGGVGKTTVAAGYSALAAADHRRVLAVDSVDRGDLLSRVVEALATVPTDDVLEPVVLGLSTSAALDEYVKRYLRIPIAPSSLGPLSRIFDFVSTAAPGVKEILTIGKIGYEAVNGPWDNVVVDAPSSGHVVELLAAPTSLGRLVPTGPLASQTQWLQELLASERAAVTVVCSPEELPVAETEQLLARLAGDTDCTVDTLVINRIPPAVIDVGDGVMAELDRRIVAEGDGAVDGSNAVVRSLRSLVGVAVDRDRTARPFVRVLYDLADEHGLTVVEVVEDPATPAAAVTAALSPHLVGSGES